MEDRRQQRTSSDRYSVSFSIAYVRVCEWAQNPKEFSRPKADILEKAKEHAHRMGDSYILSKIRECENYYVKVEATPTPKRPGSSPSAEKISKEISQRFRTSTQPYSLNYMTKEEWLDAELDSFLRELEAKGL